VKGKNWTPGPGRLYIGRGVRLIGEPAPIELRAHEEAEIWIEDGVLIEGGTSIEATRSVRVGARSRIGPFCKILDNHFHAISDRRLRPESVPIVIGEDCVLGPRAILLPGAEMGAPVVVAGQAATGEDRYITRIHRVRNASGDDHGDRREGLALVLRTRIEILPRN